MNIYWKETEYGHELIEEYSDSQLALLKFDKSENEFYISCIDNVDTGRDYLETDNIEIAKRMTVEKVIQSKCDDVNYLNEQIETLEDLISQL